MAPVSLPVPVRFVYSGGIAKSVAALALHIVSVAVDGPPSIPEPVDNADATKPTECETAHHRPPEKGGAPKDQRDKKLATLDSILAKVRAAKARG